MRRFLFQTLHGVVLMLDRELEGRQPCLSAGVVDSQSVKAPAAKERGYDAGSLTLMDKAAMLDFVVQVVRRHEGQVGGSSALCVTRAHCLQ